MFMKNTVIGVIVGAILGAFVSFIICLQQKPMETGAFNMEDYAYEIETFSANVDSMDYDYASSPKEAKKVALHIWRENGELDRWDRPIRVDIDRKNKLYLVYTNDSRNANQNYVVFESGRPLAYWSE